MSISFVLHGGPFTDGDHFHIDFCSIPDERLYSITILGRYQGKQLQLDFDPLHLEEVDQLIAFLQLQRNIAEARHDSKSV